MSFSLKIWACIIVEFVPHLLSEDQKQSHVDVSKELVNHENADENFWKNIVIGDETWVYGWGVETKAQSLQWVSKNITQIQKSTASVVQYESDAAFFDREGVIHHKLLPHGQMLNKEYYLQVMKRLREAARRKMPDLWKGNKWLLHRVNAPVHSSLLIWDFLTKHETMLVPQPLCSPDLAQADFFLFTKLKSLLKAQWLESVKESKAYLLQSYTALQKSHSKNASKTGRDAGSDA